MGSVLESGPWKKLTPDLILRIAAHCHPNDAASNLKLVDAEACACLRSVYRVVTVGQELKTPIGWMANRPLRVAGEAWPGDAFVKHWGRPEPWRALTHKRRSLLLCLAASSHHAASLEAALTHCGVGLASEVLETAAAAGDLAACQRLVQEGCEGSYRGVQFAAYFGHLHVLQWAWAAGPHEARSLLWQALFGDEPFPLITVATWACAGGQGHVLTWLESGPPLPHQPHAVAACGGQAEEQEPGPSQGQEPGPSQGQGRGWGAAGGQEQKQQQAAGRRGQQGQQGQEQPMAFSPDPFTLRRMVQDAASHGHAHIVERLLGGPTGRYAPLAAHWVPEDHYWILFNMAEGSSPEVLQRFYDAWVPRVTRLDSDKERAQLLSQAVSSTSGGWQAKVEFLLSRWATGGAAGQQAVARVMRAFGQELRSWRREVWASHDYAQRWRFLVAQGLPDGWQLQAVRQAAVSGNCTALAELLNAWAAPKTLPAPDPRWHHGGAHEQQPSRAAGPWPGPSLVQELGQMAVREGQLPVLHMLWQRYGPNAVQLGVKDIATSRAGSLETAWYLARMLEPVEGPRDARPWREEADEVTAGDGEWDEALSSCVYAGADESLLGMLVERYRARMDLPQMVKYSSVQTLDWALGVARAQNEEHVRLLKIQQERAEYWHGLPYEITTTFTMRQLWLLASRGNLAAASWLLDCGLLSPPTSLLPHPADFFRPGYDYVDEWEEGSDGFGGSSSSMWPDHTLEAPSRRVHAMGYLRLWVTRNMAVTGTAAASSAAGTASGVEAVAGGEGAAGGSSVSSSSSDHAALVQQWDRLIDFASTFQDPPLLPHQLEWLRRRRLEVVAGWAAAT